MSILNLPGNLLAGISFNPDRPPPLSGTHFLELALSFQTLTRYNNVVYLGTPYAKYCVCDMFTTFCLFPKDGEFSLDISGSTVTFNGFMDDHIYTNSYPLNKSYEVLFRFYSRGLRRFFHKGLKYTAQDSETIVSDIVSNCYEFSNGMKDQTVEESYGFIAFSSLDLDRSTSYQFAQNELSASILDAMVSGKKDFSMDIFITYQ